MNGTKIRNKTDEWRSQERRVFESLSTRPQTRLQVSVAANTPLQNVCRYVKSFRDSGKLIVLRRDICPISKMMAEVISTDPTLLAGIQTKMFE